MLRIGSGSIVVAEDAGTVATTPTRGAIVDPDPDDALLRACAMAVAPDHATSGQVHVTCESRHRLHRVGGYTRDAADPARRAREPASRRLILSIDHSDQPPSGVHFVDDLEVGPDGMLHVSSGDSDPPPPRRPSRRTRRARAAACRGWT